MLTPSNPEAPTTTLDTENISNAQAADVTVDRAFGLWADHKEDGLAYQQRMRRAWQQPLYDLVFL